VIWRIRSRSIFADLAESGRRVRSGPIRMMYVPLPSEHPQLAMAMGRRFGNAVERNRARRRVRAAFAAGWQPGRSPMGAFLVSGNRQLLTARFSSIVEATSDCLTQLEGASKRAGSEGR